jgi:hypothetical protein
MAKEVKLLEIPKQIEEQTGKIVSPQNAKVLR